MDQQKEAVDRTKDAVDQTEEAVNQQKEAVDTKKEALHKKCPGPKRNNNKSKKQHKLYIFVGSFVFQNGYQIPRCVTF